MRRFSKVIKSLIGDNSTPLNLTMPKNYRAKRGLTERELLQLESEIGAELFGPLPAGRTRSFFCFDDHTWIWHESWKDVHGQPQEMTVRYEIQGNRVLKAMEGPRYEYIEGDELKNLQVAAQLYYERVAREVYHVEPTKSTSLA